MLADLALEFKVQAFIYSSALQPDPKPGQTPEYSRISKRKIENYCKSLTEKGLNWMYADQTLSPCAVCALVARSSNLTVTQTPAAGVLHGKS